MGRNFVLWDLHFKGKVCEASTGGIVTDLGFGSGLAGVTVMRFRVRDTEK